VKLLCVILSLSLIGQSLNITNPYNNNSSASQVCIKKCCKKEKTTVCHQDIDNESPDHNCEDGDKGCKCGHNCTTKIQSYFVSKINQDKLLLSKSAPKLKFVYQDPCLRDLLNNIFHPPQVS
jgi:hypothetical protein